MEYSFLEKLIEIVQKKMGEKVRVEAAHVTKNNGVELEGLAILKEGERYTPALYINDFYDDYKNGMSCEKIADQIIAMYEGAKNLEKPEESLSFTYENMKNRIIYRLVNFERNQKILDQIPFIRFLDLAVTFHCLIEINDSGISTIRITREMMELWNMDVNSIWRQAKINTPGYFPLRFRSMSQVVEEILEKQMPGMLSKETRKDQIGADMYILSNELGVNGSAALLYDNAVKELARERCCNFYILPSSIHEVILVPYRETYIKEQLSEMVKEINTTQVPKEDILSDQVYFYNYSNNSFEI